jgi:beta-xylosidase
MRPSLRTTLLGLLALLPVPAIAATKPTPQTEFTNPVLYADYSDPDVIADGKHFYLVASSFTFVPGIPILQSDDLVHWKIVAHVVPRLNLGPQYNLTGMSAYGKGIWAPALRKHDGRFYVFFPTPTEGIFMSSAPAITGPWTEPVAVIAQPGLEDPCPFWDDDGSAYLVRSKTGAGPLVLYRMSPDGTHVLDEGKEIVNDPVHLHTLEGPKIYKRHGYSSAPSPSMAPSRPTPSSAPAPPSPAIRAATSKPPTAKAGSSTSRCFPAATDASTTSSP